MLYIITGTDRTGKRFKLKTNNRIHALAINLWRGTVWQVDNGKRRMLKRVYN